MNHCFEKRVWLEWDVTCNTVGVRVGVNFTNMYTWKTSRVLNPSWFLRQSYSPIKEMYRHHDPPTS
jgi:hypothetical protein